MKSTKKTNPKKSTADEITEQEPTLYAKKQDLFIRKVTVKAVQKFKERAELCGLSLADYFRELQDRSFELFLDIKYAQDQARKQKADELAAAEEESKKHKKNKNSS